MSLSGRSVLFSTDPNSARRRIRWLRHRCAKASLSYERTLIGTPLALRHLPAPPESNDQPIGLLCGAAEQRGLFVGRAAGGEALEGVPHYRIAAHAFIDRKIALEHRALLAEGMYARRDTGTPWLH